LEAVHFSNEDPDVQPLRPDSDTVDASLDEVSIRKGGRIWRLMTADALEYELFNLGGRHTHSRPMLVVVLNDWVIETKETARRIALPKNLANTLQFVSDGDLEASPSSPLKRTRPMCWRLRSSSPPTIDCDRLRRARQFDPALLGHVADDVERPAPVDD
jgi:hypothetical protein